MIEGSIIPLYEQVNDRYDFVGTGFFVAPNLVATAAHVVRDGGRFVELNGKREELEIVFYGYQREDGPDCDDLAVGRLPEHVTHDFFAHVTNVLPAIGEPCTISGLRRGEGSHALTYQALPCQVEYTQAQRSFNRIKLNGHAEQLNDRQLKGLSGSPITNGTGSVVAVFTGGGARELPRKMIPGQVLLPDTVLWATSGLHLAEVLRDLAKQPDSPVSPASPALAE